MRRILSLVQTLREVAQHAATRQTSGEWFAAVLFIILVVPAGPDHLLIPMLGVTTAIGAFGLLAATRRQHQVRGAILGFAVAGAVLTLHGLLRSNDGWSDVAIPLVGGPIAWFLMAQLGNDWFARRAVDIAAGATIAISLMVYALNLKIGDGIVRWIEPSAFGFTGGGRARTSLAGITTLSATVPMVLSSVLDRVVARVPTPRYVLHAAAVVFSIPAVLLTGRQGVIGTIALFPLFLVARHALGFNFQGLDLSASRRPSTPLVALGGGLVMATGLIVMTVLKISPVGVFEDILASVGIGDRASPRVTYSAGVRSLQSDSLIDGFLERPLFGHGAGAVSPEYDTWRGYEVGVGFDPNAAFEPRPWRAELSYQLLFFEGGLVGVGLYAAAAVWAARRVLAEFQSHDAEMRSVLRATVIGALSILVGAAFNPHLRAVGAQVLLFLPVIVAAASSKGPGQDQFSPNENLRQTTSS